MRVAAILPDLPHVADTAGLGRQPELTVGNQVDHLVGGKEVSRVMVEPARPLPDDDLPDG